MSLDYLDNELYEGAAGLRHENFQLNIQLEKYKQDNLDLQVKVEAGYKIVS